jgi:hypothetical protein
MALRSSDSTIARTFWSLVIGPVLCARSSWSRAYLLVGLNGPSSVAAPDDASVRRSEVLGRCRLALLTF